MEDQTAILPSPMREDAFDTAMRGYNRDQVGAFVNRARAQIHELETRLAQALAQADQARRELAAAHEQQQSVAKPVHEEVSERLSQILRLAAEEADQAKAKAESEIAQLRDDSETEAQRLVADAQAEAERIVAAARESADEEVAQAHSEAEQLLASSRAEAEHTLTAAREQADRALSEAESRAAAINEVAGARLEQLTDTHGEAVRRLGQLRDVLTELLEDDEARGPLEAAINAAVAPPQWRPAEPEPVPAAELPDAGDHLAALAEAREYEETAVLDVVGGSGSEPVAAGSDAYASQYPGAGHPDDEEESLAAPVTVPITPAPTAVDLTVVEHPGAAGSEPAGATHADRWDEPMDEAELDSVRTDATSGPGRTGKA